MHAFSGLGPGIYAVKIQYVKSNQPDAVIRFSIVNAVPRADDAVDVASNEIEGGGGGLFWPVLLLSLYQMRPFVYAKRMRF